MSNANDFVIENGVLTRYTGPGGDVVIPAGVTEIGSGAFFWCRSLTGVTIPEGVVSIGAEAFSKCNSLTSVTLPDSVVSIGKEAFSWCSSLTSVTIPEGVVCAGEEAFSGCSGLTGVTIPESAAGIGRKAFSWCHSLTSITIPKGVISIGAEAFSWCSGLTSVTLPEGVVSIGDEAFSMCSGLTSVTIPESVTTIAENAFAGCKGLADANGMVIIRNTLCGYFGPDTTAVIPEGVVYIAQGAFSMRRGLTGVTIPKSVTAIGRYAFSECSSLTSITIMEGVVSIGKKAFSECSSLTGITLPESVVSIGEAAFSRCHSLISITIPEGVVSIGEEAFSGCSSLIRVTIPQSVTSIGERAFANCKKLARFGAPSFDSMKVDDPFGGQLPEGLSSSVGKLYPLFTDAMMKRHVLDKAVWNKLAPDVQTEIFMTRRSKTFAPYYESCVTDSETLGRNILARLSAESTDKDFGAAASFMIGFSSRISLELLQDLYRALKGKKAASKALKTVEKDRDVMRKLEGAGQENAAVHPVEAAAQAYCARVPLNKRAISAAKKGLPYADGSDVCSKNALAALLTASAQQFDQCRSTVQGDMGEVELFGNASAVLEIPEAEQIAAGLDRQALVAFLEDQVNSTTYRISLWAYARFADEDSVEKITKDMVKKARGCARDRYWAKSMAEALLLSDTLAAMRYFERYGGLEEYAQMRKITADSLLPRLHDLGLNEKGEKIYDLGGKQIRVSLNADLSLSLYDEDAGKTVKTLPKRGADPEKHAAADADMKELKKNIQNMRKTQFTKLFQLFLYGDHLLAASWREDYLNNPVLGRIAAGLVWAQDGKTFTVKDGQPIDSAEQPCAIGDAAIVVAHPMEMTAADVTAWQKYFSSHGLKQPFNQIWEPVRKLEEITENRYASCMIPYYRFLHQEKHGIFVQDNDYHNEIEISLEDCAAYIERIDWRRHEISPEDRFEIKKFSVRRYTRQANHIVAYLDRITVWDRVRQDDVGVMDIMDGFTLAQITEFIKVATENNCTNVTALLLDYKNRNFADYDPMEEFSLEL